MKVKFGEIKLTTAILSQFPYNRFHTGCLLEMLWRGVINREKHFDLYLLWEDAQRIGIEKLPEKLFEKIELAYSLKSKFNKFKTIESSIETLYWLEFKLQQTKRNIEYEYQLRKYLERSGKQANK